MKFHMEKWIGKILFIIGITHSCLGLFAFRDSIALMLHDNLLNTISMNSNAPKEAAFWFFITGLALMLIGALVNWIEPQAIGMPPFLPWSLAAITATGLIVMPVSGFGLLLIPVAGLLFRR